MTPHDPRSEEVRRIVDRIGLRWGQLSLDQAGARLADVRECADFCLSLTTGDGGESGVLPDLGPPTALAQLQVTVFDACAEGHSTQLPHRLTELLARLR